MDRVGNRLHFGGIHDITILGKSNAHNERLFNDVRQFVADNNVPAQFFTGQDKIVLQPSSKRVSEVISKSLAKLGIIQEKPVEKLGSIVSAVKSDTPKVINKLV